MSAAPRWYVPSALWSSASRAHLRWNLRLSRADQADRKGRTFEYVHPLAGRFVYHPAGFLSRRIFLYDTFERAELEFAVEQARRGGTILDVGANIGLYTAACAHAAGEHGHVIALEPAPATFAKLTETCRRLHLDNVTVLPIAAARERGVAMLAIKPADDARQHLVDARGHESAIEIPTERLDDLTDPDTVTLMKIDVEGHEVQVIEGAPRIMANGRARLIVEFFPAGQAAAGASVSQLWDLLSRTHRCVAIVRNDGSVMPDPTGLDGLDAPDDETIWNTLWLPADLR